MGYNSGILRSDNYQPPTKTKEPKPKGHGFEKLATYRWPVSRYSKRQAAKALREAKKEIGVAGTQAIVLRCIFNDYISRAVRFGQKNRNEP